MQQSVKAAMQQFVAELAVECPRLSFRDAVDVAQARCLAGLFLLCLFLPLSLLLLPLCHPARRA